MSYLIDGVKLVIRDPKGALDRLRRTEIEAESYREILAGQSYYWLYSRIKPNTTVLDIGALIGDSAFYFAMHPDVKQVISYEPISAYVERFRNDLSKSPLKKKIRIVHSAVGEGKEATISKGGHVEKVGITSFQKALSGQKKVAVKMDIEGYEHVAINENVDLSNVYAMQLEYHDKEGDLRRILEKKGFKVKIEARILKPRLMGFLYAWR